VESRKCLTARYAAAYCVCCRMLRDAGQRSIECFRRPRSALDASLPPILRAYLRNGFFGVQAFFACLLAYLALFFYHPSTTVPSYSSASSHNLPSRSVTAYHCTQMLGICVCVGTAPLTTPFKTLHSKNRRSDIVVCVYPCIPVPPRLPPSPCRCTMTTLVCNICRCVAVTVVA